MASGAHPYSVATAVSLFVFSRSPKAIISTADGIFAVRQLVPSCKHSNGELAAAIAQTAIREGRNVSFDTEHEETHLNYRPVTRSTAAVALQ